MPVIQRKADIQMRKKRTAMLQFSDVMMRESFFYNRLAFGRDALQPEQGVVRLMAKYPHLSNRLRAVASHRQHLCAGGATPAADHRMIENLLKLRGVEVQQVDVW